MRRLIEKVREAPLLELSASVMFACAALLCIVMAVKVAVL